ncbi:ABC transporter permease [Methanocella sp. MCL-LM]|uniref:ABC transporter permease n=1 Tax=Methanocella sp. MCL-LM TaxID=3412035 RepID=UPI003C75FEBF
MSNLGSIAKKECVDLINSKIVLLGAAVLLLYVGVNLYEYHHALSSGLIKNIEFSSSVLSAMCTLTLYGSFFSVIIGFSSIANEKKNHALNTLIVKPLYRDTIINGKLLGACCFMSLVFGFALLIYVSGLLMLSGEYISTFILDFAAKIAFVYLLSLIYDLIFVTLSMTVAIIVDKQAIALIISTLIVEMFDFIVGVNVTQTISHIINSIMPVNMDAIEYFIVLLSPKGVIGLIINNSNIFSPIYGACDVIGSLSSYVIRLCLYLFLSVIVCYMVFMRRDIV